VALDASRDACPKSETAQSNQLEDAELRTVASSQVGTSRRQETGHLTDIKRKQLKFKKPLKDWTTGEGLCTELWRLCYSALLNGWQPSRPQAPCWIR